MEVRLHSPRSKFKITNRTDDQVDLSPEDIAGASFSEQEIKRTDRCSTKVSVKIPLYKCGTLTRREIVRANTSLVELRRNKEKLSSPINCEFVRVKAS